jgi:hypothetical protein
MASQNSPTWLLGVRYFTSSSISWLSSIIFAIAFSQAIVSTSISMVFADGALLAYSITLPLFSQFYLTLDDVLRTLSPNVYGALANPTPFLFSLLLHHGWFTNMLFWAHCEIYDTTDGICPLKTGHQVMSTLKVAFGWIITVVCFAHAVVIAMETLNVNKTAQPAGKARLLTEADVDGGKVQEGHGNMDDAMFYQDPVVPEEKCV